MANRNLYSSPQQSLTNERTAFHFPGFFLITFGAMVVWPMLAIAAGFSMLENISEVTLLFGGLTTLFFLPVVVILPSIEEIFEILIIATWLFMWIGCSFWFTSKSHSLRAQLIVLIVLSTISLGQSALGLLMILGKSV